MNLILASLVLDNPERRSKFDMLFEGVPLIVVDLLAPSLLVDRPQTTVLQEVTRILEVFAEVEQEHLGFFQQISASEGKGFAEDVKRICTENKRINGKLLFEMKHTKLPPAEILRSSKTLTNPGMLQYLHKLCYP
jgi:hypothetical protein